MKELPILFSAPMVRAILAGTKTQTRRLIKLPPWMNDAGPDLANAYADKAWTVTPCLQVPLTAPAHDGAVHRVRNPWMWPNEPVRLWVKETWAVSADFDGGSVKDMLSDADTVWYRASMPDFPTGMAAAHGRWRPSIFMQKRQSRIALDVVSVRAERLQDINEDDCLAEGIDVSPEGRRDIACGLATARIEYAKLWEWINGAGSWEANPWVWRVVFSRVGD